MGHPNRWEHISARLPDLVVLFSGDGREYPSHGEVDSSSRGSSE
jgi:hypothetical protein